MGWPTLALWRDALELWLSQTHTRTYTHTCVHTHGHTVTHSRKLFGAQLSFLHKQSSSSAAGLLSSNTGTHTLNHAHISKRKCIYSDALQMHSWTCNISSWIKFMLEFCLISVSKKCPFTRFQKISFGPFSSLVFWLVLSEQDVTELDFTSVFYPATHVCHFGDELQIE